ncbi:hypothetical protein CXG81DRAFT_17050 [Caulochytrium protostelioides]|uniref:Ribosomal protein L10 n=1 Tax=Caulochytrium protostelioides TaxID=1555241 RepID=A0A4P9XD99_9FUNG|nr:hypothetical protein CXG81DRAFT_17050 [Caulochytrium protostelioides]|eukprot:RKP03428.1 hypothetical protein CXG81DRAFT_17050 [Caulochytrium protostelioides]
MNSLLRRTAAFTTGVVPRPCFASRHLVAAPATAAAACLPSRVSAVVSCMPVRHATLNGQLTRERQQELAATPPRTPRGKPQPPRRAFLYEQSLEILAQPALFVLQDLNMTPTEYRALKRSCVAAGFRATRPSSSVFRAAVRHTLGTQKGAAAAASSASSTAATAPASISEAEKLMNVFFGPCIAVTCPSLPADANVVAELLKATGPFSSKFLMLALRMEGELLTLRDIQEAANLPSRSVLLGQLAGLLDMVPQQLVSLLQRTPEHLVSVLQSRANSETDADGKSAEAAEPKTA